jgi:transcriptional regulator with XRE-family HTH domain
MIATHNQRLWKNVKAIQQSLALSDHQIAEVLGMSETTFQHNRSRQVFLSVSSVERFSGITNVTLDELFSENIDLESVRDRFTRAQNYIPERYAMAAFSRRRTCVNVLAYLEFRYGFKFKREILQKFRISESVFLNPDEFINIQFLSDLCEELKNRGVDDQALFSMGTFSAVTNYHGPVGHIARSESNTRDAYERIFTQHMHLFDRNSDYKLVSLKDNVARVKVKFTEELKEGLKSDHLANSAFCMVRAGVGCSFPMYFGLPVARLTKDKCIHQGDEYCLHDFDFSEAVHRERLATRLS